MFASFLKNSGRFRNLQAIRNCANNTTASASKLSKEETERLAARKLRAASNAGAVKQQASSKSSGGSNTNNNTKNLIYFTGAVVTIGVAGLCINDIRRNRDGFLGNLYYGSPLESMVVWIDSHTTGQIREVFYNPSTDKLLPDFPSSFYGDMSQIPADAKPPPVLILDLERTLIASTYDAKHGWRHVKRPGVDKFLTQLRDYYEIVIFSENDKGMTMDVMDAIDPQGRCHKFGSSEAKIRDGIIIKPLDCMNRDMSQIILIDDSTDTAKIYPKNALIIKPYDNIYDKNDTALLELIPLLQAIIHEQVGDVREVFDIFGTHDAHQAAVEYKMRIVKAKTEEYRRRNKGLGALIRGDKSRKSENHLDDDEDDAMISSHGVPSPLQIVGTSPSQSSVTQLAKDKEVQQKQTASGLSAPIKKKGALFNWLEEAEKKKLTTEEKRMNEMNKLYNERLVEKAAKEKREIIEKEEKQRILQQQQQSL